VQSRRARCGGALAAAGAVNVAAIAIAGYGIASRLDMLLVLQGAITLRAAFIMLAVSMVVAASISLLGFLRTRWEK
jgi:hypothetical protein